MHFGNNGPKRAILPLAAMAVSGLLVAAAHAAAEPTGPGEEGMRLEVSLSEPELYEYQDGELANTFPVTVGEPDHETPTGEWVIHRVDWNPDSTPPDGEWAGNYDPRPPGHPENPMGRVRLVYDLPFTVHGTDDLESLGEAASRGSIRMANEDIIGLAKRVMEAGGEPRSDEWYDEVLGDPEEMVQISLPRPVPISNIP
jgi:lipoprotein-anchoring transpeptidase ErfK/SrfK